MSRKFAKHYAIQNPVYRDTDQQSPRRSESLATGFPLACRSLPSESMFWVSTWTTKTRLTDSFKLTASSHGWLGPAALVVNQRISKWQNVRRNSDSDCMSSPFTAGAIRVYWISILGLSVHNSYLYQSCHCRVRRVQQLRQKALAVMQHWRHVRQVVSLHVQPLALATPAQTWREAAIDLKYSRNWGGKPSKGHS